MAFELGKFIKKHFPEIPLIFGGIHPTSSPRECLEYCDAVNIGEGEHSIVEIAQKLAKKQDYKNVNNLAYLDINKNLIVNPLNPLLEKLDSLPLIRPYTRNHIIFKKGKIKRVDQKEYIKIFPRYRFKTKLLTSRGCPNACSFCCNSILSKLYPNWGKIRNYSPEYIINQTIKYQELLPKMDRIFLVDDDFLARDPGWLWDFCDQWKNKINLSMNIFAIYSSISYEKIKMLKNAGLKYVALGLQTASPHINKMYNRHFDPEHFLNSVDILHENNIRYVVHNILDNPWEGYDDYKKTLDIITRIPKPFLLSNYSLKLYPGTALNVKYGQKNEEILEQHKDFSYYYRLSRNPINSLFSISHMISRKNCFFLFGNIEKPIVIYLFLPLLSLFHSFYFPFLALRVYGSDNAKELISTAWHSRHNAINRICAHLGF